MRDLFGKLLVFLKTYETAPNGNRIAMRVRLGKELKGKDIVVSPMVWKEGDAWEEHLTISSVGFLFTKKEGDINRIIVKIQPPTLEGFPCLWLTVMRNPDSPLLAIRQKPNGEKESKPVTAAFV